MRPPRSNAMWLSMGAHLPQHPEVTSISRRPKPHILECAGAESYSFRECMQREARDESRKGWRISGPLSAPLRRRCGLPTYPQPLLLRLPQGDSPFSRQMVPLFGCKSVSRVAEVAPLLTVKWFTLQLIETGAS